MPNNTTVCTSTSLQFRRAGQQGPTRTLTAAIKRVIKQLLGTYSITQVKSTKKKTRKIAWVEQDYALITRSAV